MTEERSRIGRLSRTKGRVFERAIAKQLREVYGEVVKRGFQSRSGRDGCDVEGTGFWIECKHGQKVNHRAALAQAIGDTDGRLPVVVAKDNHCDPVVVMRFSDWLRLLCGEHDLPSPKQARAMLMSAIDAVRADDDDGIAHRLPLASHCDGITNDAETTETQGK